MKHLVNLIVKQVLMVVYFALTIYIGRAIGRLILKISDPEAYANIPAIPHKLIFGISAGITTIILLTYVVSELKGSGNLFSGRRVVIWFGTGIVEFHLTIAERVKILISGIASILFGNCPAHYMGPKLEGILCGEFSERHKVLLRLTDEQMEEGDIPEEYERMLTS